MEAINNRIAPAANEKSFFSGRFDRGTNADNRLEFDVEFCATLADVSDLTRVVAEKKRLALLNAHVPSDSITWLFSYDEIQLICLLMVLLRRPVQPLYIVYTCAVNPFSEVHESYSEKFLTQWFLSAADQHAGGVRLMIDPKRPSFWMCKVLSAFGVDIRFIESI